MLGFYNFVVPCRRPAVSAKEKERVRERELVEEGISIWRSAIDTEKRLAGASPFPDEFSPTRAAAIEN